MAVKIANRIEQTTTTTGTGPLSLIAPAAGLRSFVAGVFDSVADEAVKDRLEAAAIAKLEAMV